MSLSEREPRVASNNATLCPVPVKTDLLGDADADPPLACLLILFFFGYNTYTHLSCAALVTDDVTAPRTV